MKTYKFLCLIMLSVITVSCNIESLVTSTNTNLEALNEKNDSLNKNVSAIEESIKKIEGSNNMPEVSNLKRIGFKDFYYGNITNEEVLEKLGSWKKIQVTERIELQNGGYFNKMRTGWYSFSEPEYIYLVNTDTPAQDNVNENSNADITIIEGPNTLEDFPGFKKIAAPAAARALKAAALGMAASSKTDNLSQKELDILMASSFQNFDGLKFTGKRLDYINLTLGSYRGTYFENCNLDNAFAQHVSYGNSFDFDNTIISQGSNKNMSFAFWKFNNTSFTNTTIENGTFTDCTFSTDAAGLVNFNTVQIKKSAFSNSGTGYFKNQALFYCTLEQVRFTDADLHSCGFYGTKFINCSVFGGNWKGVTFNSYPAQFQNSIEGGLYKDLYIYSGNYTKIEIKALGLVRPEFKHVAFVLANFSNAKINAWFSEGCTVSGGSNFSGTDFDESIFDGITFGGQSQVSTVNMQNCNFSNCEFRTNTQFIKCNLTGATFPANANVTFINCTGAPQN